MSEGLPEAILWGSTAVGQDFCIKYLVWPNLGNNLKEKMFAFDTSNHYIGTLGKLICCDWNLSLPFSGEGRAEQ